MVYILDTELPRNKSIYFSLTKIFGIGKSQSFLVCKKVGFSPNCKLSKLTPKQATKLHKFIETLKIKINNTLTRYEIMLFKKQIQIKAYKGMRKLQGLPIRGQRTRTNANTAFKRRQPF